MNPERVALIAGRHRITYGELDRRATRLAGWLLENCAPGERAALHLGNTVEFVTLMEACRKAGVIAVPVDTRLDSSAVAHVLHDAGCSLYFGEALLYQAAAAAARDATPVRDWYVCGGFLELPGVLPFPDVRGGADDEADAAPLPEPIEDAAALILYGQHPPAARRLGAVHTHRTLGASLALAGQIPMALEGETTILLAGAYSVAGLLLTLLPALAAGSTVVLAGSFHAEMVLDFVEAHHPAWLTASPEQWRLLESAGLEASPGASSLRRCLTVSTGTDSPGESDSAGARVFGVAECCPIAYAPAGSPWRALDGVDIRISSPGGTLEVRSAANCAGFWNDPQSTTALLRDGWIDTGRRAVIDPDGFLRLNSMEA